MKNCKVLVVDDDRKTVELIRLYLAREGYRVTAAYDGITALGLARAQEPDLIVLDVMLPGLDGVSVCRQLREESDVAVIMLTARITEQDRLEGLDVGADDYVVKPFSPRELTARVKAVLRRLPDAYHKRGPKTLVSGELAVDLEKRSACIGEIPIKLTPIEFKLLAAMMREPGRVFTREQLAESAYGHDFEGYDRTIDVHILNLRRKIEGTRKYIHTIFGTGYAFNPGEVT